MVSEETNYEYTGTEAPSTLRKLTNPMEVSGEGYNAPQQISNKLHPKMYKLYPAIDTMGGKMALLELQTSNSVEGKYAETFIEGITGQVKRMWNRFTSKPGEEKNG